MTTTRSSIVEVVRQRLDLRAGTDPAGTVQRVSKGASLTQENLWLLVCAAILASIGLDTSSAAVIIGAMLISPLMGPILGVGLGMGITDRHLLQRSLRELAIGTLFSLGASAAYFVLSPLATATPELIARTRPTLLDVGVAFFGGVAGIVAGSRRDLSLALPGVAIATALMPPLCTAGFGLATGNWSFFFGALYLYVLNAIFIAFATFLIARILRFPHHQEATERERRREFRMVAAVTVLATIPSMYFLYDAALRLREDGRIASFVRQEIVRPGRAAPQWEHRHTPNDHVLQVFIVGHPVEDAQADSLRSALPRYALDGLRLELLQSEISAQDLTRLESDVQRVILRAVTTANASRDSAAVVRVREDSLRVAGLARELASVFPEIEAITWAPRLDLLSGNPAASRSAFLVSFTARTTRATRQDVLTRAQALVRSRLPADSALVAER
jgi:uncharacterized hydrophobic protein (TIGR00271 family)